MHQLILGLISLLLSLSVQAADTANTFSLTTNAFLDQGALPVLYTCDGKDISPELDWANIPPNTKTLALIFSDPDAPGGVFYHWVLYNIPKTVTTLPEALTSLPTGVVAGKNSKETMKYTGPCPPKDSAHTYVFTLYALDNTLKLEEGSDGKTVLEALQKHVVGKPAILTTVYSRWIK